MNTSHSLSNDRTRGDKTAAWTALQQHFDASGKNFDARDAFAADARRFETLSQQAPYVFADLSKNRLDGATQALLMDLARQSGVAAHRDAMFAGEKINNAENRAVMHWLLRTGEKREVKTYPDLASAVARMKEVNPHLPDEIAQHLTLHGTNWNSDGSLFWKFDNYLRFFSPYGTSRQDLSEVLGNINCPTLLFWGKESFFSNPEQDGITQSLKNYRLVEVEKAGHWLHHDQLDLFLAATTKFLLEDE